MSRESSHDRPGGRMGIVWRAEPPDVGCYKLRALARGRGLHLHEVTMENLNLRFEERPMNLTKLNQIKVN